MIVRERLDALRRSMTAHGADYLLITSDDYHGSEYVSDYFKSRAYFSGFTGSAGTLLVGMEGAWLFTDGRYFIVAEQQLKGSGITLMKSGTDGVPVLTDFIISKVQDGMTLAFDGKCVAHSLAEKLRTSRKGATILSDVDFPALVWENRPPFKGEAIWQLDEKFHGCSHESKLSAVRDALAKKGCTALLLSSLCDIAWLYNLRGGDVPNQPVFFAFAIVTKTRDMLFIKHRPDFPLDGVEIYDYDDFWTLLPKLVHETVLLDKSAVSDYIVSKLRARSVNGASPTQLLKAKKNETELANTRRAHLADGLAVTKFMLELKYGSRTFDEVSAADYLLSLRKECAQRIGVTLLDESFSPICGFGANAAIVHYTAQKGTAATIDKNAPIPMLLIDSGGQYLEGTTDITRTIVLGELPEAVRTHFTLVAMGMLRLSAQIFPEGCSGKALDAICRAPLWQRGLDFRHGTGHGVGHLLSVHEGPNRFHWRVGDTPLEVGMITSDEPGYYEEGSHGIRLENELCCVPHSQTEYGNFLAFETLTLCPIDLDGIDVSLLDESDRVTLNAYHKRVFDALAPYVCACDREKLAYLTRSV